MVIKLKKLNGLNGFLADIHIARSANIQLMDELINKTEELIQFCDRELETK